MEENKILLPLCNGNLILKGYDTEKDLKKASEDIKRVLRVLADASVYEIMKELAPYRLECAKRCQKEYNDMVEKLKNE